MEKITPPMPAKRALAALDQSASTDIVQPQRISKKVRAAIDAMISGDCKKICDAAAKVGLARVSLSRALSPPRRGLFAPEDCTAPRHRSRARRRHHHGFHRAAGPVDAPTNATPTPLARLDECPHRHAELRSAARHCHPPITRPSFMSRLERIRTIPVVYGGNRAGLFVALALVR
jgi:hypothetical protein